MMKFLQTLMNQSGAVTPEETMSATGTYADGIFPLTREECLDARADRMRLSYQRDVTTASRLVDQVPVFG